MIKVTIKPNEICVTGHAGYSERGTDIVCASVSTAVTMSINQMELLNVLANTKYEVKPGYLKLQVVRTDVVLEKIIENLIYTLSDLESQYPDFIQIKENL